MADGFVKKNIVLDEWETKGELFRLVDVGAGPIELQTLNPFIPGDKWKPELRHYIHAVLCARIIELSNSSTNKQKLIQ